MSTDPSTLHFGLFLSQADRTWSEVLAAFTMAEELGHCRAHG